MANISTGIPENSSILNLKAIPLNSVHKEVFKLLRDDEEIILAFQTIRDQVLFTNFRIFVANIKGITGKNVAFFSYPYSKIQYFGVETAGLLDIDSKLYITFSNNQFLQLDFRANVDIKTISKLISKYI